MTEAEYKSLPGSEALPLYDADDGRCEQIDRINDPSFDTLTEAIDLDDALDCIDDRRLDFRGGIRYTADGDERFVHAYFWQRRQF